jgi:hypothetical protein
VVAAGCPEGRRSRAGRIHFTGNHTNPHEANATSNPATHVGEVKLADFGVAQVLERDHDRASSILRALVSWSESRGDGDGPARWRGAPRVVRGQRWSPIAAVAAVTRAELAERLAVAVTSPERRAGEAPLAVLDVA